MTLINIDNNIFKLEQTDLYSIVSIEQSLLSQPKQNILLDKINMFLSNHIETIESITSIIKSLLINNIQLDDDYMDAFEDTSVTKYKLNKNKLLENYNKMVLKSKYDTKHIPKELLLNEKQLYLMIFNEIEKVNSNMAHGHYIVCNNNNILDLSIRFCYNSLKWASTIQKYDYFELSFKLDRLYPFLPPKVKYIKPPINILLIHSIANMDIWKLSNWNCVYPLDSLIISMSNAFEPLFFKHITTNNILDSIELKIYELCDYPYDNIILDVPNINTTQEKKQYWTPGTGFGSGSGTSWDIRMYIDEKKITMLNTINILNELLIEIKQIKNYTNPLLNNYIRNMFIGINILDINKSHSLYNCLINLIMNMMHDKNIPLDIIQQILDSTKDVYDEIHCIDTNQLYCTQKNILITLDDTTQECCENLDSKSSLLHNPTHIYNTYMLFIEMINSMKNIIASQIEPMSWEQVAPENLGEIIRSGSNQPSSLMKRLTLSPLITDLSHSIIEPSIIESNNKITYTDMINKEQFNNFIFNKKHRFHQYNSEICDKKTVLRVISEISSFRKNLPNNWDSSVIMRMNKTNINMISFVIIGPKDTPYHNGIFEFHGYFPNGYPSIVPQILMNTTYGGQVRFNPNLYACGKVCLSLLGTWSGEQEESWNSELSTFLQVIISIQSLIMVEKPYFNEPGYERTINTPSGIEASKKYNDMIRLYTIKVAMIENIKNKIESYEHLIVEHFKYKKDEIINTVNTWIDESYMKEEMVKASTELFKLLIKI